MRHATYRRIAVVSALIATAACGKSSTSDDISKDLEMANGSGMEMAPTAGAHTSVVSAAEQLPAARPRTTPVAPHAVRAPAPQRAPTPAPSANKSDVVAAEPQPAPQPVEAPTPAPRPTPQPRPTQQPRGGYKSVSDVIRNAPFPINP